MFSKTVLNNGLRILSERIPHVRSVSIGVWICAGSRDESKEENGLSHFIEHMSFKGTKKRTAKQIASEIESIGGSLNGYTDRENACFYAKVLDTHLEVAVELLADIILNSIYAEEEIEKEKDVVKEEIRMYEDDPEELIPDVFANALWQDHPLGRPILGDAEIVSRFSREDIIRYRERHYLPCKMIICAAGNLEHDRLIDAVNKFFVSSLSEKVQLETIASSTDTPKAVYQQVNVDRPTRHVYFCLGKEGIKRNHPDRFTLGLLSVILGGGMSSRLFQEIRENRALAYTIQTIGASYKDTGYFGIAGSTSPKKLPKVFDLIYQELNKLIQSGVSPEELRSAKEQLKGNLMLGLESTGARCFRLADMEIYFNQYFTLDETIAKIEAVTLEDINRLANQLFSQNQFTLATIGPQQKLTFP